MSRWLDVIATTVTFLFTARLLGPASFGIFGMALLATMIPETVIGGALSESLIQRQSLRPGHVAGVFVMHIVLALLLMGGLICLSPLLAAGFQAPVLGAIIPVLGASLVVLALGAAPAALLQRDMQFATITIVSAAGTLSAAAVGIGCALAGMGVWSLVFMELVRRTVRSAGFIIGARWRPSFRFTRTDVSDLLHFNLTSLGGRLLRLLDLAIPRSVVGWAMGPAELGRFNFAIRIQEQATDLLFAPLHAVALPVASALQHDRAKLNETLVSATHAVAAVAYPVYLGMVVIMPSAVPLFFGSEWVEAIPLIQITLLIGLALPATVYHETILRGCGRPGLQMKLAISSVLFTVLLVPIAAQWGLQAICWALVCQNILTAMVGVHFIKKVIAFPMWRQCLTGWEHLAAASVMAAVVMLLNETLKSVVTDLQMFGLLVMAGAITHACALALISPLRFRQLRDTVLTISDRLFSRIAKRLARQGGQS